MALSRKTSVLFATLVMIIAIRTQPLGAQSIGNLKFRVGVVFKSGDVRPLARTDFFLLPKNLDELLLEAAEEVRVQIAEPFDSYIGQQANLSSEFKNWLKRNNLTTLLSVENEKSEESVTVDDLLTIPEFSSWLQHPVPDPIAGFITGPPPKYPNPTSDKRKQEENMAKYRKQLADKMKEMRLGRNETQPRLLPSYWIDTMIGGIREKLPNADYSFEMMRRIAKLQPNVRQLALKYAVGQTKTSLAGDAEISDLAPGQYWLTNLVQAQIGSSSVFWELSIAHKGRANDPN